jgi:hypothetical protein
VSISPGHIFQLHHRLIFHTTCGLEIGPALVMRGGLVLGNGFIVPGARILGATNVVGFS